MEVFRCVSTLSSVRTYQDREVSFEVIQKVLEAGRLAPSAHNDQPWEFVLITEKQKLKDMAKYCMSGRFISQSAFGVVVLTDPGSKWREIDTTRAAQNMILTAWSLDLGSCWIGKFDADGLRNLLNVPDRWDILTVLPFGYFDKRMITTEKYRKDPEEVFHLNLYGKKIEKTLHR